MSAEKNCPEYIDVFQYLLENYKNFVMKEKPVNGILESTTKAEHFPVIKYLIEQRFLDFSINSAGGQTALHCAAQEGNLEVMKFLLERGMYIEARNDDDMTPLLQAALKGQLEAIKLLVAHGADVHAMHKSGATVLNFAVRGEELEVFKYIFEEHSIRVHEDNQNLLLLSAQNQSSDILKYLVEEKGFNAHFKNASNESPLTVAIKAERFDTVAYLIGEQGVDVTAYDLPLFRAIETKNLEMIQYILDNGANIHMISTSYGMTPILHAAFKSNLKSFLYLLERGANIENARDQGSVLRNATKSSNLYVIKFLLDEKNFTCDIQIYFKEAVACGTLEVVKYFVEEKKATFQSDEETRKTVLHDASLNQNVDVVKYFVEDHGFDMKARDSKGYLPLFYAVESNNLNVVKYFVDEKKLSKHLKDKNNRSILHIAAMNGHLDIVQYLVEEHNINLEFKDNFQKTPFLLAAESGNINVELLKYLLYKGSDCTGNLESEEYTTNFLHDDFIKEKLKLNIVHIAAKAGDLDILKFLIEKRGMQSNERDSTGQTPLFYAAGCGMLDAVKYLVENAACDIHIRNKSGHTALYSAALLGKLSVSKYLIGKGGLVDVSRKDLSLIVSIGTGTP